MSILRCIYVKFVRLFSNIFLFLFCGFYSFLFLFFLLLFVTVVDLRPKSKPFFIVVVESSKSSIKIDFGLQTI